MRPVVEHQHADLRRLDPRLRRRAQPMVDCSERRKCRSTSKVRTSVQNKHASRAQPMVDCSERRKCRSASKVRTSVQNKHASRAFHQRFAGERGDLLATLGHPVLADVRRDATHLLRGKRRLRQNLQRLGRRGETRMMRSRPDRLFHHPRRNGFTNGPLQCTRQREKKTPGSGCICKSVRCIRSRPADLAGSNGSGSLSTGASFPHSGQA